MGLQLKGKSPDRNEPCPCGSGLKAKDCHLDPIKQEICNQVANEKMSELIFLELILEKKIKKGLSS